jgi:AraC-like DNA-binding protein/ABC-type glycerol-3-phosphate transport system substrate-binding protein/KaiC/GvpD/RAD55 family RecA-like ATPase
VDRRFGSEPARARDRRVTSGVTGLDGLLGGGFLEGSCAVLAGPASTGKTWFTFHFLRAASLRGEAALYVHLSREHNEREALHLPEPFAKAVSESAIALRRDRLNRALSPWLGALLDELPQGARVALELAADVRELSARELGWIADAERLLSERGVTSLITVRAANAEPELIEKLGRLAPGAGSLLAVELRSSEWGLERQLLVASVKGAAVPSRYYPLDLGPDGLGISGDSTAPASRDEPEAPPLYIGAPPYLQGELKRLYVQRLRRHLASSGAPGLRALHGRPFFSQLFSELYAPRSDFGAVLVSEPGIVRHLADKGLLMELEDVFPEHNDLFIDKALRRSIFFGHLYAAPQHVSMRLLFYRRDLLKKHGLEPPRTWAELESQAKYVVRAERNPELSGLLFEYRPAVRFGLLLEHVWASGEDLYGERGGFTFNSKRVSEALARLRRLVDENKLSRLCMTPSEHWDVYQQFFGGKAVFLHHWSDGLRLIFERGKEARERFGWCVLPTAEGSQRGYALAAGVSYVVPKNTRQPELARLAMRRLMEPEFLARNEIEFGWPFPAFARLYEEARVLEAHPYYAEGHELLSQTRLLEEAPYIEGDPFEWSRVAAEAMGLSFKALRPDALEPEAVAALMEKGFSRLLPKPTYSGLVTRAVELVDRELAESLTGEMVAGRLGVSRPYLAAIFRRETGHTLHDYVTDRRVTRAKELLQHSELGIGEIATRLGFKTIFHFSRLFKDKTGHSPRKFRNQR